MPSKVAAGTTPVGALFRFPAASGMTKVMEQAATKLPSSTDRADLVRLLARVAEADRGAFAALYQRTSAKLYGICLRLLGSEAEAQDVLQDVYVTVWQKAHRFDPSKASPITWLCVLARNRCIDRLRRGVQRGEELEAASDIEDDSLSAFDLVEQQQQTARLSGCLDQLDEQARRMIRAAFLDGTSYPELAEREGVPLGTMKSWIRRGLQRLRGCLEQ